MLVQFYFCLKLKVCKLKKQYCLVLKIVFTFILKFTSFILKFTTLILKFTTFVQKFLRAKPFSYSWDLRFCELSLPGSHGFSACFTVNGF